MRKTAVVLADGCQSFMRLPIRATLIEGVRDVTRDGVGRFILTAAIALALAACGSGDDQTKRDENGNVIEAGTVSVFSLNVGDCFVDLPTGDVSTVDVVPCADAHSFEIYHEFDIDLDAFDAAAVQTAASDGCLGAFEPYMGVAYEQSYYDFDGLQPSAGSWEQDDREVICLATPTNGGTTQGTARGAGLLAENAGGDLEDEQGLSATTTTEGPVEESTTTTAAPEETTSTTATVGGTQSVFELSVGECYLQLPDGTEIGEVEAISCNEPHGIEIYHLFDIDLPAFDLSEVQSQAADGCLAEFEPYAGISYEESWYEFDGLLPTEGSWAQGDREVVCFLEPYDENISVSVGSAKGQARRLNE